MNELFLKHGHMSLRWSIYPSLFPLYTSMISATLMYLTQQLFSLYRPEAQPAELPFASVDKLAPILCLI